jgi:hypothetical protein
MIFSDGADPEQENILPHDPVDRENEKKHHNPFAIQTWILKICVV